MTSLESKISSAIKPVIEDLGYELYDVIYEKEGKDNYLRIFIDKAEGISLNDCENVNNSITDLLDEKDFIKSAYFLEVSSTGIEKRLRNDEHLEKCKGDKIEIHLYKMQDKQKIIIGVLKDFNDNQIVIDIDNKKTIIERSNISNMKTVYDWK